MTPLGATGLPVGLFSSVEYATASLAMERGDALLLYTDGVTESRDASDVEYGADRVVQTATRMAAATAAALVAGCRDDLASFRAGSRRTDDVAILAVQRAR